MSDRQRLSVEQIQAAMTAGAITEHVALDLMALYREKCAENGNLVRELDFVKQELSIARFRAKTAEAVVTDYVEEESR